MKHALSLLAAALLVPLASVRGQSPASAAYTVTPDQAGPAIAVTEWTLPRADARPQATFVSTRDGSVWYSDAEANLLGRFDPKTAKFEEFHLRPGSDPYGFVEHYGSGVQTTVFFTSRTGGFVGEFDLNKREVRELRLDGGPAILHDLAFDPNGDIWFTVAKAQPPQHPQGSKIGRANVFSSEIRLVDTPTRAANPHALVVNSVGTPFFTELDSPRLASIHPMTLKVTEYVLPNAKSGARGLAITPDDVVWYTDYARGYIGRLDPKTRAFDEWPSPGGANSRPAAITNIGDTLWYMETGATPRLVRFASATKQFHSWTLKMSRAIEHLYAHRDGSLWFAVPSSNRVAQITLKKDSE
jgi:virginiamycin B lyase